MIADSCPFGRAYCDGCNYLITGGCIAKLNTPQAVSITHDDMVALWKRRKENIVMKANAPEKIYVQLPSSKWIGRTWNENPIQEGQIPNWKNATNIEYVRTDAFIEKAKEFLSKESNIPLWEGYNGNFGCDMPKLVEKFINHMKGE